MNLRKMPKMKLDLNKESLIGISGFLIALVILIFINFIYINSVTSDNENKEIKNIYFEDNSKDYEEEIPQKEFIINISASKKSKYTLEPDFLEVNYNDIIIIKNTSGRVQRINVEERVQGEEGTIEQDKIGDKLLYANDEVKFEAQAIRYRISLINEPGLSLVFVRG